MGEYMVSACCTEGVWFACDWRWPNDEAVWVMSDRESDNRWSDPYPLNEVGRQAILKHFGLESMGDKLPLVRLPKTSPKALLALRRRIERKRSLPRLNPVSNKAGNHIPAKLAA